MKYKFIIPAKVWVSYGFIWIIIIFFTNPNHIQIGFLPLICIYMYVYQDIQLSNYLTIYNQAAYQMIWSDNFSLSFHHNTIFLFFFIYIYQINLFIYILYIYLSIYLSIYGAAVAYLSIRLQVNPVRDR